MSENLTRACDVVNLHNVGYKTETVETRSLLPSNYPNPKHDQI